MLGIVGRKHDERVQIDTGNECQVIAAPKRDLHEAELDERLGYGVDHSEIIRWLESLVVEAPEETDQSAK